MEARLDRMTSLRSNLKFYFTLGTAGDSLSKHHGYPFTTKDRDNDIDFGGECAEGLKGGWWHYKCYDSNLNGVYRHGKDLSHAVGIDWNSWKISFARRAEMKIRQVEF